MKKKKLTKYFVFISFFVLGSIYLASCEDSKNPYEEEPEWLGASIYEYLSGQKEYTYYLRMIDAVKYDEVLKRTGSNTVFAVKDASFEAFFADNNLGIRRFEDFSESQLRLILFSHMLKDAYLLEMLSNATASGLNPPTTGQVMRKNTIFSVLDTIPYEPGTSLPSNKYWDYYRDKGVYLLQDNTQRTAVFFLKPQMTAKGVTDNDFYAITNIQRSGDDAFLFDNKIVEQDIMCKNGYVHVLEKFEMPAENLAEYISRNGDTQMFSRFMDRYTAPFYDAEATSLYRSANPQFTDSIFRKGYFNYDTTSGTAVDPDGNTVDAALNYDPGKNSYAPSSDIQTDMAAMFVPSDKALDYYFNQGEGIFIKERYGTWENVPNSVLNLLINNHMKPSFIQSVPSRFDALEDKMGTPMGVTVADIDYAYVCNNGVAYITNKVFPPTEYISVMAPVIFSPETQVFNWTFRGLEFDLYLLSMVNRYSFFVPTDDVMTNYIDPISVAQDMPQRWEFFYNSSTAQVNAVVYDVITGDSVTTITAQARITNALNDIVDNHIVVGDIVAGKYYYPTKGGATIKISGSGTGMTVQGGGNIESSEAPKVKTVYDQENGTTYFLTSTLKTAQESVYQILYNNSEFSEFFDLCAGSHSFKYGIPEKEYGGSIFAVDSKQTGIQEGGNVSFFNTYNYTIYVPTNEAIRKAIADKVIPTWEELEAMEYSEEKALGYEKLYNFLRYHFQDNSVYISGESVSGNYDTATRNSSTNKFRKLTVAGNGSNLKITTENNSAANVLTGNPSLYNIMARDYKLNSGTASGSTGITTSSYAVIHQIDAILNF